MKCNKKNCPLVDNNENCDIRDCKWRTEDAGEVNAVKEYEDAIFQLEHNKISLGEYESLIEPLKHLYTVKPCKDAISREYALGVIYPSNVYPSRADIYKALKDAPPVTVEPKQGEWIVSDDKCFHTCQFCNADVDVSMGTGIFVNNDEVSHMNFCPNCGVRMFAKDTNAPNKKSEAESIIEACVLETATREAYEDGMADAWKIAQTVFGSTVTLYEAMDVARCMKGSDDEHDK